MSASEDQSYAIGTRFFRLTDEIENFVPDGKTKAQVWNEWKNGISFTDRNGKKKKGKPYGPPWYYPTISLILSTDVFTGEHLVIFRNRARLETLRSLERMAKEPATESIVSQQAKEAYSDGSIIGISKKQWADYQVREWTELLKECRDAIQLSTAYAVAMDVLIEIKLEGAEVTDKVPQYMSPITKLGKTVDKKFVFDDDVSGKSIARVCMKALEIPPPSDRYRVRKLLSLAKEFVDWSSGIQDRKEAIRSEMKRLYELNLYNEEWKLNTAESQTVDLVKRLLQLGK